MKQAILNRRGSVVSRVGLMTEPSTKALFGRYEKKTRQAARAADADGAATTAIY